MLCSQVSSGKAPTLVGEATDVEDVSPKPTCVLRPIVNADSCDLKYGQHFVKMNLE